MRSEPTRLGGISLDFAGIPPRLDEAQVSQPSKVEYRIFFNQFFFSDEMLIK